MGKGDFLIGMISCVVTVVCVWLRSVRLVFRGWILYVGMIPYEEGRIYDVFV